MKKRIISIMLTLVMLLTSVAFVIPANATEEGEDLSALVASALAESDNATVTLTANVTSSALISVPAGKTLTIEGNGNTYTADFGFKAVDGGALKVKNLNVVLTSTTVGYAESQAGGDLSFEGCTFSVTAETTKNGGMFTLHGYLEGVPTRISLKDCEIGVTAASTQNGQVFYSNTPNAEITLDGVKFDTSTSATKFVGCDIHAKNGVGAKITVKNGCDIKTGGAVINNYTDVTVDGSTLTSTVARVLNFNGMSSTATALVKGASVINARYEAICFQANTAESDISVTVEGDTSIIAQGTAVIFAYKNSGKAKLTLGGNSVTQKTNGYVVAAQECTATAETTFEVTDSALIKGKDAIVINSNASPTNISLSKNARVEASRYALYAMKNSAAINVTMSDSAHLYSTADRTVQIDGNTAPVSIELNNEATITSNAIGIWAQTGDTNHTLDLTFNDNSSLITKSYSISTYKLAKASINLNDNASIVSYNGGWIFELRQNPTTITVADTAAIVYNRGNGYLDNKTNITLNVSEAALKYIPNLTAPTMLDGASIRIAENSNGLRFTSEVAKDAYIVEYGTIIAKNDELGSNEFTIDALTAAGVTFGKMAATESGSIDNGDSFTYNFALINLPTDQLTTMFAARAYVVYDFNGYRVTVYSDFTEENVRSISMVANLALEDVKAEITDVEGDYDYIHKIEGVGYSRYTADQYAKIAEFAIAE